MWWSPPTASAIEEALSALRGRDHASDGGALVSGRALHAPRGEGTMKHTRVQIVGRIPTELSRRVRALAKKRRLTLNAILIEALTVAVSGPRAEVTSEPPR